MEGQIPQAKVLRTENEDSLSKISFLDTMDLEGDVIFEEAISSEDEDDLNVNIAEAPSLPTKKSCVNESFSLVLEPSDDEDLFDSVPIRDDSIEIIESNHVTVSENDTPEIEDLIADAEVNELPEYVIKTMKEFKKRKDEVFVID